MGRGRTRQSVAGAWPNSLALTVPSKLPQLGGGGLPVRAWIPRTRPWKARFRSYGYSAVVVSESRPALLSLRQRGIFYTMTSAWRRDGG
jgi:hypothetical protein